MAERGNVLVTLVDRLASREACIGVIGLGHAGLPTAIAVAAAGFRVVGFELDQRKLAMINAEQSPFPEIPSESLAPLLQTRRLQATSDFSRLRGLDAVIICVQTPVTEDRRPDLSYVEAAVDSLVDYVHPEMLVVLQSSCSPGTTRNLLLPRMRARGLGVGVDLFLAYAPERIDPGNQLFDVRNTPKLVGGATARCTEVAISLFREVVDVVIPVSSPEVAEMAKLVENTFRFVNIGFVNEVALLCDRLGMDVREVIGAAATKPFAFLPHFPSAGAGGHCIPIVPLYLADAARQHGLDLEFVDAAVRLNDRMPDWMTHRIVAELEEQGKPITGARIMLLGIAYKPNVASVEESAGLRILAQLAQAGAWVTYHDPLVASVAAAGHVYTSDPLTAETLAAVDCVVILTPHAAIDLAYVIEHARLIVDTRADLPNHTPPHVRSVWRPGDGEVSCPTS